MSLLPVFAPIRLLEFLDAPAYVIRYRLLQQSTLLHLGQSNSCLLLGSRVFFLVVILVVLSMTVGLTMING
jgi:hypothetical protein